MAKLKKSSKNKKIKVKKKSALHPETKKGIAVVVCFTLALLSFLSYFKAAGSFGQYFLEISRIFFGKGFFLIPVGFILTGLAFLKSFHRPAYRSTLIGITLFILSVLGVFHIFGGQEALNKGGGYLGLLIGWPLAKFLGFWASIIVLLALLFISILITFNIPLKKRKEKIEEVKKEEAPQPIQSIDSSEAKEIKEEVFLPEQEKKPSIIERWKEKVKFKPKETIEETEKETELKDNGQRFKVEEQEAGNIGRSKKPSNFKFQVSSFKLPPLDLLEKDKGHPTSGDIKANQNIIRRTLQNFGIEVEMAEVNIGPTITQYTLRPAQGVKLARITALHNDLALALAAHPLRIEAPIPGRALVGIEIPNRTTV
jgi:DNA segregation ATPase FtsK/SpoIIIE, S-DNA-T family